MHRIPAPRCARRDRRVASSAWRWMVLALACAVSLSAFAAGGDGELPAVVGRIANVQGALFNAPDAGGGQWTAVGLNYPVTTGDNLWIDGDGHAEIDYGAAQIRIAGDTNLHVSRLDEGQLALFVAAGRLIARLRLLEPGDSARVDTPAAQISLTRPGLYRIDVSPDRTLTTLIVREGEAEVAAPAVRQQVLPGQTATIRDGDAQAVVRNAAGIDGFDAWSADRDRYYDRRGQDAYVSRQMVGAVDLDQYGTWQTYPDCGPVWFPTGVAVDWAPYRYGAWTWLPGWGYTWVDAAPWGYAPFHYGRWTWIDQRWGWCPGAYVVRPIWAPALVAWYGGTGWGYSASYGVPVWGWVPLGWGEPLMPWWHGCGSRCWSRYNRPYHVNVAERPTAPPTHYANWSVPGGLTAVPGAVLAGGKPVPVNLVALAPNATYTPALVSAAPSVEPLPPTSAVLRPGDRVPARASTLQVRPKPRAVVPSDRAVTVPTPAPALLQPAPSRGATPVPAAPASRPAQVPATGATALPAHPRSPAPAAPVERPLPRSGTPAAPTPAVPTLGPPAAPVPTAPGSARAPAPAPAPRPAAPTSSGIPLDRLPAVRAPSSPGAAPGPAAPAAPSAPGGVSRFPVPVTPAPAGAAPQRAPVAPAPSPSVGLAPSVNVPAPVPPLAPAVAAPPPRPN